MPLVLIKDKKIIPGIGQGPVEVPTMITDAQYRRLTLMNYTVIKLPENTIFFKEAGHEDTKPLSEQPSVEEVKKEETKKPEVEAKVTEEKAVKAEAKVEKATEEAPKKEAKEEKVAPKKENSDVVTIDGVKLDLADMNKDDLKRILDAHSVKYLYKDTLETLTDKVKGLAKSNNKK